MTPLTLSEKIARVTRHEVKSRLALDSVRQYAVDELLLLARCTLNPSKRRLKLARQYTRAHTALGRAENAGNLPARGTAEKWLGRCLRRMGVIKLRMGSLYGQTSQDSP